MAQSVVFMADNLNCSEAPGEIESQGFRDKRDFLTHSMKVARSVPGRHLPATIRLPHALTMFVVTEAQAILRWSLPLLLGGRDPCLPRPARRGST